MTSDSLLPHSPLTLETPSLRVQPSAEECWGEGELLGVCGVTLHA